MSESRLQSAAIWGVVIINTLTFGAVLFGIVASRPAVPEVNAPDSVADTTSAVVTPSPAPVSVARQGWEVETVRMSSAYEMVRSGNRLGRGGWELVTCVSDDIGGPYENQTFTCFWKRPAA